MEPTEAELRQGELYASTKYSQNDRSHCAARLAYADALAERRVDAEKIRAEERERCAMIAERFPLLMSHDTRPIRLAIAAAIRGGAE